MSLNETAIPLREAATSVTTLATIGFVVFLALPPIVALAWSYTKRTSGKDRLTDYRLRFTFAFARPKFLFAFLALAISYLITGLLASLYWIVGYDWLVLYADYLEIANMIASIVLIVCLGFATIFASTNEMKAELNSASAPEAELKKAITELGEKFGNDELIRKFFEYLPKEELDDNVDPEPEPEPVRPRRRRAKKKPIEV